MADIYAALMERITNIVWAPFPEKVPELSGASIIMLAKNKAYMISFERYQDARTFLQVMGLLPSTWQTFKCLSACFELAHRISFNGKFTDALREKGAELDMNSLFLLSQTPIPSNVYSYEFHDQVNLFFKIRAPSGMPVVATLHHRSEEPQDVDMDF